MPLRTIYNISVRLCETHRWTVPVARAADRQIVGALGTVLCLRRKSTLTLPRHDSIQKGFQDQEYTLNCYSDTRVTVGVDHFDPQVETETIIGKAGKLGSYPPFSGVCVKTCFH